MKTTIPKITALSPEQKRVMIAEEWGFEPGTINQEVWLGYCDPIHAETLYQLGCDANDSDEKPTHILAKVPYFVGDLNAMHEAEKVLTPDQQVQYTKELSMLTRQGWANEGNHIASLFPLLSATASQRADAFLIATERARL